MLKNLKISTFIILALLCSCNKQSALVPLAKHSLPALLDKEMKNILGTVDKPKIQDVMVIYDCDSLCVLQCKASAHGQEGSVIEETVRYFFVKDNLVSVWSGKDTYYHMLQGAPYLDKQGIKDFRSVMNGKPQEAYQFYMTHAEPVYGLPEAE